MSWLPAKNHALNPVEFYLPKSWDDFPKQHNSMRRVVEPHLEKNLSTDSLSCSLLPRAPWNTSTPQIIPFSFALHMIVWAAWVVSPYMNPFCSLSKIKTTFQEAYFGPWSLLWQEKRRYALGRERERSLTRKPQALCVHPTHRGKKRQVAHIALGWAPGNWERFVTRKDLWNSMLFYF